MRRITRKGVAPPCTGFLVARLCRRCTLAGLGWGMNPVRLAQPLRTRDGWWSCCRARPWMYRCTGSAGGSMAALRVLTAAVQRQAALSLGA